MYWVLFLILKDGLIANTIFHKDFWHFKVTQLFLCFCVSQVYIFLSQHNIFVSSPLSIFISSLVGFLVSAIETILLGLTLESCWKFDIFPSESSSPYRCTETECLEGVTRRCFVKKGVCKNLAEFTENSFARIFFLINFQSLDLQFYEKRLWHNYCYYFCCYYYYYYCCCCYYYYHHYYYYYYYYYYCYYYCYYHYQFYFIKINEKRFTLSQIYQNSNQFLWQLPVIFALYILKFVCCLILAQTASKSWPEFIRWHLYWFSFLQLSSNHSIARFTSCSNLLTKKSKLES